MYDQKLEAQKSKDEKCKEQLWELFKAPTPAAKSPARFSPRRRSIQNDPVESESSEEEIESVEKTNIQERTMDRVDNNKGFPTCTKNLFRYSYPYFRLHTKF